MGRTETAIVLLACLGLVALSACGSASSRAAADTAQQPNGWRTYGDAKSGYSIAYPPGWALDRAYVYPIRVAGKELGGVSLTVPVDFYRRTNLGSDTRLSVEVAPGPAPCEAARFLDAPENVLVENDGGHAWSVASGTDAGAGNFYDETVYALVDSKPCLAIRYFIHATNIANYDPGVVRQFDRTALMTTFDRMRATLAVRRAAGEDQ